MPMVKPQYYWKTYVMLGRHTPSSDTHLGSTHIKIESLKGPLHHHFTSRNGPAVAKLRHESQLVKPS